MRDYNEFIFTMKLAKTKAFILGPGRRFYGFRWSRRWLQMVEFVPYLSEKMI